MAGVRLVCALLLMLLAGPALGQEASGPILPGESRAATQLLTDARLALAEQKWPEAINHLQAIIDSHADDLVPAGPRQVLPARRLAHSMISRLPGQALELYRTRIDPQARSWLQQGLDERQPRFLLKTVQEAFCSRPAEKALDALGDLAFERGDFTEAEAWWRCLLPAPKAEEDGAELHYPGAALDPARLQAKVLLAQLFRDGPASVTAAVERYREQHGSAEGRLAGQTGSYADILHGLLKQKQEPNDDRPWLTLGGDAGRGLVMPAPANLIDRLGQMGRRARYRFSLEKVPGRPGPVMTRARAARSLAFVPVIAGGQVLVADARSVMACDLRTGSWREWYDAARHNGGIRPDLTLPAPADLRYTLTVAEDCVFARLGEQEIKATPARAESLLVCLAMTPGPGGDRLLWQARPGITNDHAVFEGAPVVHAGHVYIAATRCSGGQAITAIHCYPTGQGAVLASPPLRWRKDVCEWRSEEKRYRHQLLTLAGPNVVYCSHTGVIVALDALSGRRAWALRYPPRPAPTRPDEQPPLTDLSPCLCSAGRLYVAPTDSDRILCLDPTSGRLLWERNRLDVVHLLGVSQAGPTPLLVFTTPTGLKAISAGDGSEGAGWVQPDGGVGLATMGRGLLVGDVVLWPTVKGIKIIQQANGWVADPTLLDAHRVPSGNLAFGERCLAVADQTHLTIFVPPGMPLAEPRPIPAIVVRGLPAGFHPTPPTAVGGLALPLRRSGTRTVPPTSPLPAGSRFHQQADRLYWTADDRRLLAGNFQTGQLLWQKWAPGGMLGDAVPDGRFLPGWRVLDRTILVQTGTGRRWLLDADTGHCLHDAPADRQPWPRLTGDGSGPLPCLIREGEKIIRLNPPTGKEVWSWPLPAAVLRTHEPIQLHATAAGIFVLTPTNLGLHLQRLHPDTGAPFWSKPPYVLAPWLDLSVSSVDSRSIFLVRDQMLTAMTLGHGRMVWEKSLTGPKGTWKTLVLPSPKGSEAGPEDVLLAYPDQIPARRWELCWLWGSLQWIVGYAPEAQAGQGCPIHCLDPGTGQLIQRLNLPAGLPQLVREEKPRAMERFLLQPMIRTRLVLAPSGLTVRVREKGLEVVLGSQAWGYDGRK